MPTIVKFKTGKNANKYVGKVNRYYSMEPHPPVDTIDKARVYATESSAKRSLYRFKWVKGQLYADADLNLLFEFIPVTVIVSKN